MTSANINPVGYLQEFCQKYSLVLPQYEEINSSGPDHAKEFSFKCEFNGLKVTGVSRQKKQAKTEAAKAMIKLLDENDFFENLKTKKEICNPQNGLTFTSTKNPISVLNEYCQQKSLPPAKFVDTSAAGLFICECEINEQKTYGQGPNKKSAKTEAAYKMCEELQIRFESTYYPHTVDTVHTNPVSALEELLAKKSGKPAQYNEFTENNQFVVSCTVGSLCLKGRGPSKKLAKFEAARKMLEKIQAQKENFGKSVENVEADSGVSTVLTLSEGCKTRHTDVQGLVEFDISESSQSEDETVEKEEKEEDLSKAVDVHLRQLLEATSLEPREELKDVFIKINSTNQAQEEMVNGESN